MIKNPVFKVGDLVVYINDDYEANPERAYGDASHVPLGAILRVCSIVRGLKGAILGYECRRASKKGTRTYGPQWYARRDEIHPADDEP